MNDRQGKRPVSPEKLAANRKNAQRSSGPKTAAGKQRSSQNRYQHGFYASRLFPTKELLHRDRDDYNRIVGGLWDHYAPVGDFEKLCVEKIAVEMLRLARLFGHEQKVLGWGAPFEARSMDRIVRYESNISRQLEKTIAQLERLQEQRAAQSDEFQASEPQYESIQQSSEGSETSSAPEPSPTEPQDVGTTVQQGVESTDGEPPNRSTEIATSNPLRHEETCEAPEDDVSTSTPAAQSVQDGEEQGVTNSGGEPTSKPAGTNANNLPEPENCVTDAGVQMSNKTHEQAMEKEYGEDRETEPIGSSRFIETKEDEEFVEWVKSGKDLDLIEDLDMFE